MKANVLADSGLTKGASGIGKSPKSLAGGMKGIGLYPSHPVIRTARIKA